MKTLPVLAVILMALGAPQTVLAQEAKLWSDAGKAVQLVDAQASPR